MAQVNGLYNCAFAAGTMVGPVWAGLVKDHFGWNTMSWSLGLASALMAPFGLFWIGGWIGSKEGRGRKNAVVSMSEEQA